MVALACSILFAALALIDTEALTKFFTHQELAQRLGVAVRAVTREGAEWFRAMCAVSAFAWICIPWIIVRIAPRTEGTRPDSRAGVREPSRVAEPPLGSRAILALICALLLGLALRVDRISESLWFDEISALIDYAQHGPGAILGTYFVQSNHVLHTLLSWCTIALVGGVSEPSLRLPALIAGIASIAAIALLARECARWCAVPVRGRMAVAAGIAALAPIMVLESVEARGYSMMILFSAIASWQFLSAWRTGASLSWVFYALACALGVWSHLVLVALPLSHGIIALSLLLRPRWDGSPINTRVRALSALLALLLAAITTLTLLMPLLPDLLRIRSEFQALDGNEPSFFSPEGFHLLLGIGGAWTILAASPGIALVFIALFGARHDQRRRLPLAVLLLGLPLVIAATEFAGSWMYARFALFALPGLIIAMTWGTFDLSSLRFPLRVLGAIAAILLWTLSLATLPAKQPIREAVSFIRASDPSLTRIASAGLANNVVSYYGVLTNLAVHNAGAGGCDVDAVPEDIQWMVVLYPRSLTTDGAAEIARGWNLVKTFPGWVDWNNGDVLIYRRRESAVHE